MANLYNYIIIIDIMKDQYNNLPLYYYVCMLAYGLCTTVHLTELILQIYQVMLVVALAICNPIFVNLLS